LSDEQKLEVEENFLMMLKSSYVLERMQMAGGISNS